MSLGKFIRNKRGAILVWGIFALVVALIAVLAANPKPAEKTAVDREKAVAVRTRQVEPRPVADVVKLPGRIEPLQEAHLGAQRAGQVVERLADKGQVVKAGEILLRLDSRLWDAARRRAEIVARDTARDLKRWKELEKTGAVAVSDYEAIQRRQEAAEIALEEAQVMLAQCEVCAPFSGVIVDRMVEVGDYANEGQAVFRVVRLDRVKVAFDVPEQDVGALQAGKQMSFTLAAVPNREFTGEISFLSSQAARESNSFPVELEADNADGALKAGMIAEVALVRRQRAGAVVVPLAAVIPRKGEHYVFTVENGRAVRKRILLGDLVGSEAMVEGGLAAGERMVVEGHRGLQDGMAVTESEAPAAAADAAPVADVPAAE